MNAAQRAWASEIDIGMMAAPVDNSSVRIRPASLALLVHVIAALLSGAGVLALAGWGLSLESLKSCFLPLPPVRPGSAIGFVLAGLFLWSAQRRGVATARLARFSAISLLAGSVSVLVADFCNWKGGLAVPASMPSFLASLAFACLGGPMFMLHSRNVATVVSQDVLIVAGMLISLLALLGYICHVPTFYSWTSLFGGNVIPLETAVLLALLGCGILAVTPATGLSKLLFTESASGRMIRRLILAPVLIPLATGLLKSLGLRLGIYNAEFANWLFAYLNLLILTLAICWSARLIYAAECLHEQAEGALQRANEGLELRVRKRTEELSLTEARFRTLVEQSLTGIYAIQDDRLTYVNPKMCEITGFSAAELTSAPLMSFIFPEDRALVANNIQRRLERKVPDTHYILRMVRKDGGTIHTEVHGSLSEYGGRPAILGTLLDVTERKRAEEQIRTLNADLERRVQERTRELALANKELESFSYSVSHDLRAPLRHMGGFLELLQKRAGPALDEKAQRYFKIISDSVTEMGTLIDNLLSFSRMGRAEMRATTIDLNQLVAGLIKELAHDSSGRDVLWEPRQLPEIQADLPLLRQVFVNLLSNALKYTRTRTRALIEIGCLPGNGEHVFFVRDNGVGFDMQYAEKLFGVFQRLHRADEFEGTGIGLANVQRIIHRHGGRTWAQSAVDQGATFFFSLPATCPAL